MFVEEQNVNTHICKMKIIYNYWSTFHTAGNPAEIPLTVYIYACVRMCVCECVCVSGCIGAYSIPMLMRNKLFSSFNCKLNQVWVCICVCVWWHGTHLGLCLAGTEDLFLLLWSLGAALPPIWSTQQQCWWFFIHVGIYILPQSLQQSHETQSNGTLERFVQRKPCCMPCWQNSHHCRCYIAKCVP